MCARRIWRVPFHRRKEPHTRPARVRAGSIPTPNRLRPTVSEGIRIWTWVVDGQIVLQYGI